jgi:hypothetical protein
MYLIFPVFLSPLTEKRLAKTTCIFVFDILTDLAVFTVCFLYVIATIPTLLHTGNTAIPGNVVHITIACLLIEKVTLGYKRSDDIFPFCYSLCV